MYIHPSAAEAIQRLEAEGHQAYVVGGCVRDSLMGLTPHDWDLCTSALPAQIAACFPDARLVETGLQHGTLTVVLAGQPLEVTTFRTEGAYSDGRHPDQVSFVTSLQEDLARRDFTMNAMAYSPRTGLVDLFGGQRDITARLLRTVGDADQRFQEDGLRILRGLRFASRFGFAIHPSMAQSIHSNRALLHRISPERIREELTGLLMGADPSPILGAYVDVLAVWMPEVEPMVGFIQHNPHHRLDVWGHTLEALAAVPPDINLRLALLLHDTGKPASFTQGPDGLGHFYEHEEKSAQMAESILRRLKYDNQTLYTVCSLVRWHGAALAPKRIIRWLHRLGEPLLRQLLQVQRADILAQAPEHQQRKLLHLQAVEDAMNQAIAEHACYQLQDLAISGKDLLALGMAPGKALGATLQALLETVMDQALPNQREALLEAAQGQMLLAKHASPPASPPSGHPHRDA